MVNDTYARTAFCAHDCFKLIQSQIFTYEEILVIFRDCTEFLIDSDNNIRIVLMIVEFVEYIEFKGVLRRSSWEEFATVAKELSLHSKFCFHWINLLRDILVRVCLSSEIMIIHTQLIMRVTWKISLFSLKFSSK